MIEPYLSFKGKMSRGYYAIYAVFIPLVLFIVLVITNRILYPSSDSVELLPGYSLYVFLGFLQFAPTVKRLHDIGQSGWLGILVFIPYLGDIQLLLLLFWPKKKVSASENNEMPQL